jgi:hypothetical protein
MVKIFINNYEPSNMLKKLVSLEKYLVSQVSVVELYSNDGIFLVEHNKVLQLVPDFNTNVRRLQYGDLELFIDHTKVNKIEVLSQLPTNYLEYRYVRMVYKLVPTYNVELVLEMMDNTCISFYFIYEKEEVNIFNNKFFLDEFNEFLLLLN